jgi:pimeloyl-ACP methyl ester carboxylesterase
MNAALGSMLGIAASILGLAMLLYRRREPVAVDEQLRATAPGRFVESPGGRTHYVIEGPDDGELVVLVPGATLPLWVWRDLPANLASAGFRVLRYDLLGRGFSSRPWTRYDRDLFDAQLHHLLAGPAAPAPGRKVHLVGLAFGCLIACEYARRHGTQVASVALLGADGFGVSMSRGDRVKQWPVLGDLLFRVAGNTRLMTRLQGYTADPGLLQWLKDQYAPELLRKGFKRALLSSVRHMPIHDARALYQCIDASPSPMAVIWGSDDRITPPPPGDVLKQTFANSATHRLDHAGHLPHVERLQETTRLLVALFTREILE